MNKVFVALAVLTLAACQSKTSTPATDSTAVDSAVVDTTVVDTTVIPDSARIGKGVIFVPPNPFDSAR